MEKLRLKGEVVGVPCCYGLGGFTQYSHIENCCLVFPVNIEEIIEGELEATKGDIIVVTYKSHTPIYLQKGDKIEVKGSLDLRRIELKEKTVQSLSASLVYNETFNF